MGILKLLPMLPMSKSFEKEGDAIAELAERKHMVVGVDAQRLLYRGAICNSVEFFTTPTTANSSHIQHSIATVEIFIKNSVEPILVFDGARPKAKLCPRVNGRTEALKKAREEQTDTKERKIYYSKAVRITPSIVHVFINALKKKHPRVSVIVAPYEADAQLAFMDLKGMIDAVYTPDSDLIPFGCKRVMICDSVKFSLFEAVKLKDKNGEEGNDKVKDFSRFNEDMLLDMCILMGSDYLEKPANMDGNLAYRLITEYTTYENVINYLGENLNRFKITDTDGYKKSFKDAKTSFKYQNVYDPGTEQLTPLNPIPSETLVNSDYVGEKIPNNIVKDIANNKLDPITYTAFTHDHVSVEDKIRAAESL